MPIAKVCVGSEDGAAMQQRMLKAYVAMDAVRVGLIFVMLSNYA